MTVAVEHEELARDAMADLTRDAGRELRNEPCGEGRVEVRETDEFRWMHFGDAALQPGGVFALNLSPTELAARAARWSDRLAFDLRDAAARLTCLPARPES
jgi:hypothetical protein